MDYIFIVLLSSFKFAFTFPIALARLSYTETLIFTNMGGILGVYVFSGFSELLLIGWNKITNFFSRKKTGIAYKKKIFTKYNRRLVRIKNKYGFPGIVILNPVLLSIPVSSFLVVRYYKHIKLKYLYLIAGLVSWSLIYTFFYGYLYEILFKTPVF
ncbi:MAG: hypothetical protein JXJ22_07235 [Bacteroidales bacterium]|nr:hypothetical protein [Bacteroidales bacterium]